MDQLFKLPDGPLVSVLVGWLSLKDFGRLDSAACNRKCRVELHRLISSSKHAFARKWINRPNAQWMIERGAKCSDIHLLGELLLNPLLRKEFLIHSGSAVQSCTFCLERSTSDETNGVVSSSLQGILQSLSTYCTNLKQLHISNIMMEPYKYDLSRNAFASLEMFLEAHKSRLSLTLTSINRIPVSLLLVALQKLNNLSLWNCSVDFEDELMEHPAFLCTSTFQCTNTYLPSFLCKYVSNVSNVNHMSIMSHGKGVLERIVCYTNLRQATLDLSNVLVDNVYIFELICQFWTQLEVLCVACLHTSIEVLTFMLIKHLPKLRVLNTVDYTHAPVYLLPSNGALSSSFPASSLPELRMYCNSNSTLEQVLQLCPQLSSLSLVQWVEQEPGELRAEKSLHLLHNTSVRALHLQKYMKLCNDDLVALQNTQLHTLTIDSAGEHLLDKAILTLIPTLHCLHTLRLTNNRGLTYKLVLGIPPLSPSLRRYTYKKAEEGFNDYGWYNSNSSIVLSEVLPKIFPHVKQFDIDC